jgi:hypothetical protein
MVLACRRLPTALIIPGAVQMLSDRRHRRQAQALRRAVHELPTHTRKAMLAAVEAEELIVGAYTDRRGRVCPMLAAHRLGARTDVGNFPRAWDAFGRARRPRLATPRELEILEALLQESLHGRAEGTSQDTGPGAVRQAKSPVGPLV